MSTISRLELDAISARVSLLVTSMLTLVTQFSGLKAEFPPVAYVKAVDIWMAGCLMFVFGALGEFVFVKVIYVVTEEIRSKMSMDGPTDEQPTENSSALPSPSASSPPVKSIQIFSSVLRNDSYSFFFILE